MNIWQKICIGLHQRASRILQIPPPLLAVSSSREQGSCLMATTLAPMQYVNHCFTLFSLRVPSCELNDRCID